MPFIQWAEAMSNNNHIGDAMKAVMRQSQGFARWTDLSFALERHYQSQCAVQKKPVRLFLEVLH